MSSSPAAALLLLLAAGCHASATTEATTTTEAHHAHSSGGHSHSDEHGPSGATAASGEVAPASAAQRRYEEGAAAAARHDWQAAAQAFSDAYGLEASTELAFNAGRMFEHLADFDHAAEWYQRVLVGHPSEAVRAQVTDRLTTVLRDAQRLREGNAQAPPDNAALSTEASSWFDRGMRFFRRHQWREALQAFETANQFVQNAGGNAAELMFNLGVTHEHLGHRAEAEAAFRSYLEARPDAANRADIEQRIARLRGGR